MPLKPLRGRVALILSEEDFDVDQIVGIANIGTEDPETLSKHVLDWCGEEFATKVRSGDLIVAGENFGFGHPHYPTMIAMRYLGIAGVIAESFSPGYWRGEIARGFPQVSCPGILAATNLWDELEVDWAERRVANRSKDSELEFEEVSASDIAILEAGGLVARLKAERSALKI